MFPKLWGKMEGTPLMQNPPGKAGLGCFNRRAGQSSLDGPTGRALLEE